MAVNIPLFGSGTEPPLFQARSALVMAEHERDAGAKAVEHLTGRVTQLNEQLLDLQTALRSAQCTYSRGCRNINTSKLMNKITYFIGY